MVIPIALLTGIIVLAVTLVGLVAVFAYPNLPSLEALTDYQPRMPLRVLTADGVLIGEFGEERRMFVRVRDLPVPMKQAILAAEDERFYEHGGVDTVGVLRATAANVFSGGKRQGASTITMQVARNFFLSSEKTLTRKVYEVLLAFKIENNLTKDEILELYVNQIYLGQRAYGFGTAAQIYFGKTLQDLSIAEVAMLAGLPKAPSAYNPVANPKRARLRQLYVLRRMRELGFINQAVHDEAVEASLRIKQDTREFGLRADYVAEMARQIAVEKFKEDAYTRGYTVVTTIQSKDQKAANAALRKGVMEYDRRHGYRGAEGYVDLGDIRSEQDERLDELLSDFPDSEELQAAIVLEVKTGQILAYRRGEAIRVSGDGLRLAMRMMDAKAPVNRQIRRGAIIRVVQTDKGWEISQMPDVEAALISVNTSDGQVKALVGGFDYYRNKFNHVTQAWRQPGSSFKPFIYSAALERGFTPASVIDDSPISFPADETGSQSWEPKNYDGKYDGPITMRTALTKSKNMVSIRLLKSIGTKFAQDYATRFGFDAAKHPPYLTMALGAGAATPWQMAGAYAVFANGGYRIQPHVVKEIIDNRGATVAKVDPPVAPDDSLRVIDARNAYLMDSMMRDVVRKGTATKALSLKRNDLAGKTGTTNDYQDAWFCGYQPGLVAISWIGFDQPRKLGDGETGGQAALPIWIQYMAKALQGVPEVQMAVPEGLSSVTVTTEKGATSEMIYQEAVPPPPPPPPAPPKQEVYPPVDPALRVEPPPATPAPARVPPPAPAPAPAPQTPAPVRDSMPAPVKESAPKPIRN